MHINEEPNEWAIIDFKTGRLIMIFKGTFTEVMTFANKNYEDGIIDIESYENWCNRQ